MNSFELNKILGAVLGTLLLVMGLNLFSGILFSPHKPEVSGYDLPLPEATAAAGQPQQQQQAEPLPVMLASASADKGKATSRKCAACHTLEKGGKNGIGPNLYGVVTRPKGSVEGFAYSPAMKGKGGNWSYEDLFEFVHNPKGFVPGTIMAFAGIPAPKERADLLAYLRTLSDNPPPLPAQ